MMKRISFFLFLVLIVSLITGCAGYSKMESYGASDVYAEPVPIEYERSAESGMMADAAPASAPMMTKSSIASSPVVQSAPSGDSVAINNSQTSPGEPAAVPEEPKRRRIYSGALALEVEDVTETSGDLTRLAQERGGYIEGIWDGMVILRVPAEQFFEILADIEGYGRLLNRNIETKDVTDLIRDLASRRRIAQDSRERLYALLEKSDDAEERLRILREIRRLTEELEGIDNLLSSLEKQIAFSRIQVSLIPRLSIDASLRAAIPFPWISSLHPVSPSIYGKYLDWEPDLGDNFAVFSDLSYYFAESPEGVRVRMAKRENNPSGDVEFWMRALEFHLSPLYDSVEIVSLNDRFKGVLLKSKDRDAFYYMIVLTVLEQELLVAEVFFPDEDLMDQYRSVVLDSLEDF